MSAKPADTIHDIVGIRNIEPGCYQSVNNPERMGNALPIAYGGCALGVAAMAAHEDLPSSHRIYSLLGNYLGPASTDRKLDVRVQQLRKTRTFTTRLVTVSQKQDDGADRPCMVVLADFHHVEPAALFSYSEPPRQRYQSVDSCMDAHEYRESLVKAGKLAPALAAAHQKSFGLMGRLFESRTCEEGMAAQTMNGLLKNIPTTQDSLVITDRTSADWFRCRSPLLSRAEHASTLAFIMDAAVSFIPLTHHRMFLDDAGPCSSLDFALRFFTNDFDMTQFHLREWKAITAGVGRTYSESRLWDTKGTMVASMTQASVLRPKASKL